MTITEKNFARKLAEAFDGRDWKPVVDIIKEVTGHEFAPEPKPLPTEPGSVIIATEVRGVKGKWRAFLAPGGVWFSPAKINGTWWHDADHITAWTEVVVVPVAAAPVTLTEDQVGEVWDKGATGADTSLWLEYPVAHREEFTRLANDILAQHAAPAEDEPIDPDDVLEGDLVRLEMDNGDEVTITVTRVGKSWVESRYGMHNRRFIRAVYLLHREEA